MLDEGTYKKNFFSILVILMSPLVTLVVLRINRVESRSVALVSLLP